MYNPKNHQTSNFKLQSIENETGGEGGEILVPSPALLSYSFLGAEEGGELMVHPPSPFLFPFVGGGGGWGVNGPFLCPLFSSFLGVGEGGGHYFLLTLHLC